jgi:hypothetical protein
MVFGLTVYAVFGTFSVMAAAMVIRRWGEYALIRPGREMLFSKVDKESKYKAKNVCDVAVYRIADATFRAGQEALDTIGMGGTAQALIAAAVAGLWAFNGWWLGRRFEKEKEKPKRCVGAALHTGNSHAPPSSGGSCPRVSFASFTTIRRRTPRRDVRVRRRYRYHEVPEETYDGCGAPFPRANTSMNTSVTSTASRCSIEASCARS